MYSGSKQLSAAFVPMVMAFSGLALTGGDDKRLVPAGIISVCCAVVAMIGPLLRWLSKRPALKFDNETVEVSGWWWGHYSAPWSELRALKATRMTTYVLGVIPTTSETTLYFKFPGGWFSGIYLNMRCLDVPPKQWPELISELVAAKDGAVVAKMRLVNEGRLEAETAHSVAAADAVIARYLAAKPKASIAAPPALRGLRASPLTGDRPQFGRRAG